MTADGAIRVLHLRSCLFLGSPERMILGRATAMDHAKCTYVVGIFDEQRGGSNDFHRALEAKGIESFALRQSMRGFLSNLLTIKKKIAERKISLIVSHDYKSNFYAGVLHRILSLPSICVLHGKTKKDLKGQIYNAMDDRQVRIHDAIVCVSRQMQSSLSPRIPRDKTLVIPNAVDVEAIDRAAEEDAGFMPYPGNGRTRNIVFIGRLSEEKGLPYLVKAAGLLNDDVHVTIIGDGPEAATVSRLIRAGNLEQRIHCIGFRKNVYPYLKHADLLVLPSLKEGMPVVILEAFALGKPVVATDVGGIPEVVRDGESGILVRPADTGALARAITAVLADREKARAMGERGRETVSKRYTSSSQARAYLSLYQSVMDKHNA